MAAIRNILRRSLLPLVAALLVMAPAAAADSSETNNLVHVDFNDGHVVGVGDNPFTEGDVVDVTFSSGQGCDDGDVIDVNFFSTEGDANDDGACSDDDDSVDVTVVGSECGDARDTVDLNIVTDDNC